MFPGHSLNAWYRPFEETEPFPLDDYSHLLEASLPAEQNMPPCAAQMYSAGEYDYREIHRNMQSAYDNTLSKSQYISKKKLVNL